MLVEVREGKSLVETLHWESAEPSECAEHPFHASCQLLGTCYVLTLCLVSWIQC
jgi:hypothetical protein